MRQAPEHEPPAERTHRRRRFGLLAIDWWLLTGGSALFAVSLAFLPVSCWRLRQVAGADGIAPANSALLLWATGGILQGFGWLLAGAGLRPLRRSWLGLLLGLAGYLIAGLLVARILGEPPATATFWPLLVASETCDVELS